MGSMKLPPTPFFPEMSTQLFVGGRRAGGRAASQPQGLRVSTKGILCPGDRWTDRQTHSQKQRVKAAKRDRARWSETERKRIGEAERWRQ